MNTGGTVNGTLSINNSLKISRVNGASVSDIGSAAIKVSSNYHLDNKSRPGITLENNGTNACMIFLNPNGDLMVIFNDGILKKISLI